MGWTIRKINLIKQESMSKRKTLAQHLFHKKI